MNHIKQTLLLAAEMLELASAEFGNHGCNDLSKKVISMIPPELCDEARQWNSKGTDPWPERPEQFGDSGLMHFLSHRLRQMATEVERDVKINTITNDQ